MTLFWRIFLIDAAILTGATVMLLLGPVTVSTPVVLAEALILTAGLAVLLVANAALLRGRAVSHPAADEGDGDDRSIAAGTDVRRPR